MTPSHSIADKLAQKELVLSAEFYPPRKEEETERIRKAAKALQPYGLDYVSITYGAGGSTRELTIDYGALLHEEFGFEVMPHLTCVGHSREEISGILKRFDQAGFYNIMTLRGDPPQGEEAFRPHPEGFTYASELVAFIKRKYPKFCLGVGGYPEKHPEAASMEEDLEHLKHKLDQGADFIVTQLFFDNEDYFRFVEDCRKLEIMQPIIPGILPTLSYKQLQRFASFCGAKLPKTLLAELQAVEGDPQASRAVGIEWAWKQIEGLIEFGIPGIHFYILNRAESAEALLGRLQKTLAL